MQKSRTIPGVPRRSAMQEWKPEEIQIYNLIQDIEKLGAHPLLTDVVVLLGQAKDKLSDWFETDDCKIYWQAEIVGKDGNLTGLTYDDKYNLVPVGEGMKFKTETVCMGFILHAKPFPKLKPTEHMDVNVIVYHYIMALDLQTHS